MLWQHSFIHVLEGLIAPVRELFKSDASRASPREEHNVFLDSEWRSITGRSRGAPFGWFGKKTAKWAFRDSSSLSAHKKTGRSTVFYVILCCELWLSLSKRFYFGWNQIKKRWLPVRTARMPRVTPRAFGPLSARCDAFLGCGWRRRTADMQGSCEYIE
jgi:hypothetical protein